VAASGATSLRTIIRGSTVLLAARGVQAVLGIGSLVVTARALHVSGYGNFATAFAAAGTTGGVLSAALSDSAVTAPAAAGALARLTEKLWIFTLVPGAAAAIIGRGPGWLLGAAISAGFIGVSASSASRMANARNDGRALSLGFVQVVGSVATLGVAALLSAASVHRWQPFILAYALQPAALLLLPRPVHRDRGEQRWTGELVLVWRATRSFLVSQTSWFVIGGVTVIVVRIAMGAQSAGRYAALARLFDVLAVIGPLMGLLALPALVDSYRSDPTGNGSPRINFVIAALSVAALSAGIPFIRSGWNVLYPHAAFPTTIFLLLTAGYGFNVATGLPDRVLQGAGNAGVVARYGAITAIILPFASFGATVLTGLPGAAAVLFVALAAVNVLMLIRTRVTVNVLLAHATLASIVVLGGVASLLHASVTLSAAISAATLIMIVGTSMIWHWRLWGSPLASRGRHGRVQRIASTLDFPQRCEPPAPTSLSRPDTDIARTSRNSGDPPARRGNPSF
jgi:O-antigen/teichoic acid export membrane protein